MINWKVRLKSPAFWTGLIGVLGAFAVGMAQLFGVDITAEGRELAAGAHCPGHGRIWRAGPGGCYHRPDH